MHTCTRVCTHTQSILVSLKSAVSLSVILWKKKVLPTALSLSLSLFLSLSLTLSSVFDDSLDR